MWTKIWLRLQISPLLGPKRAAKTPFMTAYNLPSRHICGSVGKTAALAGNYFHNGVVFIRQTLAIYLQISASWAKWAWRVLFQPSGPIRFQVVTAYPCEVEADFYPPCRHAGCVPRGRDDAAHKRPNVRGVD